MIGMTMFVPSQPVLSTVKVPPPKSSSLNLLGPGPVGDLGDGVVEAVDREGVGVADTGTIRPSSTATATPMLIRRLARRPCSVQWALNVGLRLSASADALTTNGTKLRPMPSFAW